MSTTINNKESKTSTLRTIIMDNEDCVVTWVESTNSDYVGDSLSRWFGDNVSSNLEGSLQEIKHRTQLDVGRLEQIYSDRLLCDIILIADGLEIYAHKLILSTCSVFFYWQFSKDKLSSCINRLEVDIEYDTLSAVVDYFYKSEIAINEYNVENLLEAAYKLGVNGLQDACNLFLTASLSPRNCMRKLAVAKRFKNKRSIDVIEKYIGNHFNEIIKCDNFLDISYEQLLALTSSEEVCATEEEILKSVIMWVGRDAQNRKEHVFSLLENIRFSLITPKRILETLEAEGWLTCDPRYNAFLREIFLCMFLKGNSTFLSQPRLVSKVLLVAGVTGGRFNFEMYDFQTRNWVRGPLFDLEANDAHSVAILGTKIYTMDHQRLEYLDINKISEGWIPCGDAMEEAPARTIAVLNNQIYVVGCDHAWRFDGDNWTGIESPTRSRYDAGLGVLDGKLYAVGGTRPTSHLVECYDPSTNSWSDVPPMTVARRRPGVGAFGDTLFVAGGYSGGDCSKAVEVFDPLKNVWRRLPDMNVAKYAPGIIEVNKQVYVIGGSSEYHCLSLIEVYDPVLDTWSQLKPMSTCNQSLAMAIFDEQELTFF